MNPISERIEDLEDIAVAWKHKYEKAVGISNTVPFELAEFINREQPTVAREELGLVPA